jgi:hypothetical protein
LDISLKIGLFWNFPVDPEFGRKYSAAAEGSAARALFPVPVHPDLRGMTWVNPCEKAWDKSHFAQAVKKNYLRRRS